eukprot:TRINITY_DN2933_c4_g1_i2.p1 TRINITY_DN2933_c4_g1~~TRINITY_DN2933_c4_g1_i2.p1  ORF type:complete len:557 (+),score=146.39 TRINITY_DN2933_c4_g1_i2:587-2257(+)
MIKKAVFKRRKWEETKVLIIDEISMIHPDFFKLVNEVGQLVRGSRSPFGGLQIVLTGDFLQLPPVDKENNDPGFIFQTDVWDELDLKTVMLTKIIRQESDNMFKNILNKIRIGDIDDEVKQYMRNLYLKSQHKKPGENITMLYTHNVHVDDLNLKRLNALNTAEKTFISIDSGPKKDQLDQLVIAPRELKLKIDAIVMLLKNTRFEDKYLANGSIGRVVSWDDDEKNAKVTVEFDGGYVNDFGLESFDVERQGQVVAKRRQVPLKLAWATTIHKSQGLTLSNVAMDLSSCFAPGHAYVALSRAKSAEGIHLINYDLSNFIANPSAVRFIRKLRLAQRKEFGQEYDDTIMPNSPSKGYDSPLNDTLPTSTITSTSHVLNTMNSNSIVNTPSHKIEREFPAIVGDFDSYFKKEPKTEENFNSSNHFENVNSNNKNNPFIVNKTVSSTFKTPRQKQISVILTDEKGSYQKRVVDLSKTSKPPQIIEKQNSFTEISPKTNDNSEQVIITNGRRLPMPKCPLHGSLMELFNDNPNLDRDYTQKAIRFKCDKGCIIAFKGVV